MDLVVIQPPEALVFRLSRDAECRVRLFIKNVSNEKIAFKVKTTMPACYFVKPNQGVLGPSGSGGGSGGGVEDKMTVDIALTKEEANRLIELAASGIPEKTSRHRFMVQNKVITESEFEQLDSFPAGQRAEKYAQIWATTDADEKIKQDKLKKMLNVVFEYPAFSSSAGGASSGDESKAAAELSVSENVALLRNKLAHETSSSSGGGGGNGNNGTTAASAAPGSPLAGDMMSKEKILEDLGNLKKKFDAMIQYTVSLTTERDTLKEGLEEALRERARDAARLSKKPQRDGEGAGAAGAGAGAEGGAGGTAKARGGKKATRNYFLEVPFPMLVLAVFVAFFAGKYLKR